MWFPTKRKVTFKLAELYGLAMNLQSRLAHVAAHFAESEKTFGPVEGLKELQQEVADTAEALYIATAAVECEQVRPKTMAKSLPTFDRQMLNYTQTVLGIERSISAFRTAA